MKKISPNPSLKRGGLNAINKTQTKPVVIQRALILKWREFIKIKYSISNGIS
jgi:hypothetical protein